MRNYARLTAVNNNMAGVMKFSTLENETHNNLIQY